MSDQVDGLVTWTVWCHAPGCDFAHDDVPSYEEACELYRFHLQLSSSCDPMVVEPNV